MDLSSINLEALPKPIRDMLGKMDPDTLKSMVESMKAEELDALLAGAMGYFNKMSPQDKNTLQEMAKNLFTDKK